MDPIGATASILDGQDALMYTIMSSVPAGAKGLCQGTCGPVSGHVWACVAVLARTGETIGSLLKQRTCALLCEIRS